MSGKASRDKGARAERAVCAALIRAGWQAITSRNARGGTQGHDDIVTDLPVSIEVKDWGRDNLPGWLRQARTQADDCYAVVVHKQRGKAAAENWFATMQFDEYMALIRNLQAGGDGARDPATDATLAINRGDDPLNVFRGQP